MAKKYWPYAVGGVAAIFIIMKMRGGGSSGGSVDLSGMYAAQAAASSQAAQLGLQSRQLDIQAQAAQADGVAKVTAANAQAAAAAGASATGIIQQLYAPGVAAINAAAAENVATLQSAALLTSQSYQQRANMVLGTAGTAAAYANAIGQTQLATGIASGAAMGSIGAQAPALAQMNRDSANAKSDFMGGLQMAGQAVAAYYTGGASLAATGFGY